MKSCGEREVDTGFVMTVCYDAGKWAGIRERAEKKKDERSRGGEEVRLGTIPVL